MYKCNDCNRFFDEPLTGVMESDTGYVSQVCPHCGSDYYEEAKLCPICEKEYTTDDFCEDCYEMVNSGLNDLKQTLGSTQDNFEQIIANHFGW